jgi:probable F420-dependent oxidoreductase
MPKFGERRLGITVPVEGLPLLDHMPLMKRAERVGYTDIWSGEVNGHDVFTPLVLAALCTEQARLGTGIANVFTRGPAVLAMSVASLASLAPGRVCLGLGSSSDVIVGRWNSVPFEKPLTRMGDIAEIVVRALKGERVEASLETVCVSGFSLANPPSEPVPLFVAALRSGALRLAGAQADGVFLNWLSPSDLPKVISEVRRGSSDAGRKDSVEIACRIFVCPGDDPEARDRAARRYTAGYLTVPVYKKYQEWLGRGPALDPMQAAWREGRRRDAVDLVPGEIIDELLLRGDPADCKRRIQEYFEAGADTVVLDFVPVGNSPQEQAELCERAIWALAPKDRLVVADDTR